jgi:hypothetical protein
MGRMADMIQPGKYDNISLEQYHRMDGWSKTNLDRVHQSVAYYLECKQNPQQPTSAMAFGAAFHCAILTPALFQSSYAIAPSFDRRTKQGKEDYSKFQADNLGKTLLDAEDFVIVEGMRSAILKHPLASDLLTHGEAEQSFFWTDPQTKLLCKVRPDYLRADGICVDLKTCEDASYEAFQRSIANGRYHVQAGYFIDGVFGATQQRVDDFVIIAIEKSRPYGIMIYRLSEADIDIGRSEYQKDLDTIVDWNANPQKYEIVYPASENPIEITLPAWA